MFMQWLSKHSDELFTEKYEPLDRDYVEEVEERHRQAEEPVGTATARLFSDRPAARFPSALSRRPRVASDDADEEEEEEGEEEEEEGDEEGDDGDDDDDDDEDDGEEEEEEESD